MKYLWAFSIPVVGVFGIYLGGYWSFSAFVFAFVLVPVMELILPQNPDNYSQIESQNRLQNHFYDLLLCLNLPLVYAILGFCFYKIEQQQQGLVETFGTTLSLGIILGANGINVAHELGHRASLVERIIGKLLLIPSHYTHFFIEHNHGHHLNVATPNDPSTAKINQSLYAFWWQTVCGTYKEAWKIQIKLNKTNKTAWYSTKNDMMWFTLIQVLYPFIIWIAFGSKASIIAVFAGIVGFLLLETINYIEHYGLQRSILPSGRYERVSEKHSWNSNHILGRIILYELTRHSDHHFKSQKKYQVLEHHHSSPQLPFGYPASMVLAFFPPLWFVLMNKLVAKI